jgi:Transglycosylase SLT domain
MTESLMSNMAIQTYPDPSCTSSLGVFGNTGDSTQQASLEQILELLIQELEQVLMSSQSDDSEAGGIGGGGAGGGGSAGAPMQPLMLSALDPTGGAGGGGGTSAGASMPTPMSSTVDPTGGASGSGASSRGTPAPGASSAPTSSGAPGNSAFNGSTLGPGFPSQLDPYKQDIENASAQTGVPADILAAQIWQESRGKVGATSENETGNIDAGLMQVDSATFASLQQQHPELQGQSLSNPATNILAGAYYMADNAKQFGGNWAEALRAYNSGPSQVDPSDLSNVTIGDPNYVTNVMNFASIIRNGGTLPA